MFTTWHPLASALTPDPVSLRSEGQQQAHTINFQFDRRQPCGSLGQIPLNHNWPAQVDSTPPFALPPGHPPPWAPPCPPPSNKHNAPDARISPGKRFRKREKKNRLGGYETSSRGFPSPPAFSIVHQTTETHPEGGVGPASEAPFTRSIVAARCCIPT
ncbi:hypothetical protein QC761_0049080 [Podospora bellae-mahoneyi]|uniref:Uncharacterized protein n=1 Tax=Podospora bellae-mahoneyi TaxID=2093777 RepID=A0ABR0FMS9_9PEZI|nr:hypothetical protein QC761_0049080 [Podospora bellae-mahoneyi]